MVTFAEEILNGKLYCLCNKIKKISQLSDEGKIDLRLPARFCYELKKKGNKKKIDTFKQTEILALGKVQICDALRDLAPFVQIKKREKHPWRSLNFNKVAV